MSTAYSMVTETLRWQSCSVGVEIVTVPIRFPVQDPQQLIEATRDSLLANPGIKMCLFSHISSMVLLPFMFNLFSFYLDRSSHHAVLMLCDAAHANRTRARAD